MREIKFRAWSRRHEKYMDPNHFFVGANGAVFYETIANKKTLKLRNWILEQYTGLKDKNGKEIYEGDLLNYGGNWGNVGKAVFDGKFGYSLEYKVSDNHVVRKRQESFADIQFQTEVVGNIHENPELLEVSE